MKKRLLVIGSDGFLGSKVKDFFYKDYNLMFLKSGSWDPQDILRDQPVVLMFRAISSPSFVQQNPEVSYAINVTKTSQLITQCLDAGSKVIFTSSDVVYGHSSSAIFTEKDRVNPFGMYASQKAEIEKLFFGNTDFFSLRLSLVTGQGSKLLRILTEETNPRIPSGVIRNPVHFKYVLETIRRLLECESWQDISKDLVFNIGGRESVDIFELAQRIALKEQLNCPVRIERSELDLYSRPEVTRINSDKAEDFTKLRFSIE